MVGQSVPGHGANGHSASGAAFVADGAFVDALVFCAGRGTGGDAVLPCQLHRCLARGIFLFTHDFFGIFVVSVVFRAAKSAACLARFVGNSGMRCVVRAAMAGDIPGCGRCFVGARALVDLHVDSAADVHI